MPPKTQKSQKPGAPSQESTGSWKALKSRKSKFQSKIKNYTQNENDLILPGPNVPKWWSCRWMLCYVGFFGIVMMTAINANMWIAIMCMSTMPAPPPINMTSNYSACRPKSEMPPPPPAEFNWTEGFKNNVVIGYFYGYVAGGIPGGFLSDRYGGKRVFGFVLILTSILTILLPPLTRVNYYFILIIRILIGFFSSASIPAMHSLWGRWAPQVEQNQLITTCYAAQDIGTMITFMLTFYLCANGFDNGWGSVFYVTGIAGLLYSIFFFYTVFDSPKTHPRISDEEYEFLQVACKCQELVPSIPWSDILNSLPVKAIMIAYFCYNWIGYSMFFSIPVYLATVLFIPMSPLLALLPHVGLSIAFLTFGHIADFILRKNWISLRTLRVVAQFLSLTISGLCAVIFGVLPCEYEMMALSPLSFGSLFHGLSCIGFFVNHIDLAPSYAGVLCGLSTAFGFLPGFLAPLVTDSITNNHLQSEFQIVYYIAFSFAIFGAIYYIIFASTNTQSWDFENRSKISRRKNSY